MIEEHSDYGLLLQHFARYTKAKTIVEIGVAFGYTTELLCEGAKSVGGHVYGFDIWNTHGLDQQFPQMGSKEEVQKRLAPKYDNFTLTQTDSQSKEFPALLKKVCPKINFAFIDGCHSYVGVKNDFDAVYPLLADAGIIAFHDTFRIDGCREFVLDLRTKYNDGSYDVVDLPFGISSAGLRDGLSLIIKRDFQNHDGIAELCGSPSVPQEIYSRERAWYRGQLRNPQAVSSHADLAPSKGLIRQLKLLAWRLAMKKNGLKRRVRRMLGQPSML